MKALNIIDLAVQTFILGAVMILSVAVALMGQLESVGFFAMYGAILLGPWQLVSSMATCISRGMFFRWRVIHLVSSVVYLVILSVAAAFLAHADFGPALKLLTGLLGFGIPLGLALFYYYITFKSFQAARAAAKTS